VRHGIAPRQWLGAVVGGLLVLGVVLALPDLAQANRPSRGAGPNKAGEQECSVLLRQRKDGPWLLFGAELVSKTSVVWSPFTAGVRYEATARPATSTTPQRTLQPGGSLTLLDRSSA
jgi:hypothetical protein